MDNQMYSSIQKELAAKYQIAPKELQNLYKRSIMIEPLLEMLEDIYSREEEGSAIAPLSFSINQIKSLNADIKTCLLNIERKSGPFQRIIKTKGENFDALEFKMDKLIKELEVALVNAEQTAKESSKKKKNNKGKQHNYNNNNYNNQANKQNQENQPTKHSLVDNYYSSTGDYTNNYKNYNNNNASGHTYQEAANYSNYLSGQSSNANDCSINTSLTQEFAQMNIKFNEDLSEGKNEPKTEVNEQSNYSSNQYANAPTINIQPPNCQDNQNTYSNYSTENLSNNYTSPSQQYYYGTLTKNDQQMNNYNQQQTNNYNQQQTSNYNHNQQQANNYNQQQTNNYNQQQTNNYNQQQTNNYNQQQPGNYNQQQQGNYNQQQQSNYNQMGNYNQQQVIYNPQQIKQMEYIQQPINNYNYNNYNNNYNQPMNNYNDMQSAIAATQISTEDATTLDGDNSLINNKNLIPPTLFYAISSFTPRQQDELAIEKGDEVIIVQTFDDGWAFGRNSRTRMVGVLPMTFLSEYNNNQQQQQQHQQQQYNNNNNDNLPARQSSRRH